MQSSDKRNTLKSSIQKIATEDTLSASELKQLMDMQKNSLGLASKSVDTNNSTSNINDIHKTHTSAINANTRTSTWYSVKYLSIAASLLLCISVFVFLPHGQSGIDAKKVHSIATEVVKNHVKLKPLDIKTQNVREIQRFFTQVDFLPSASKLLEREYALSHEQLLGGRYCSIQGITATQLRYQDKQHQISTLYEVGYYPPAFGHIPDIDKGEAPHTTSLKGFSVTMWVERNLFMVLVSEPQI